ncbi:MAG: NPCBM/NEW2 domain-containing protein, partial [Planctomycetes bacterium]|nr:NPCBM/NEW2 domain-containing protein [Planctomycetota bacterium]
MRRIRSGLVLAAVVAAPAAGSGSAPRAWQEAILAVPYAPARLEKVTLQVVRQDYERLERNRSVIGTPLTIGERRFAHGLGAHSIGRVAIASPEPFERFSAWAGVDANERTRRGQGSVVFSVEADGREVFRSKVLRGGAPAERIDVAIGGAKRVDLLAGDAGDGPACDHADWADAEIVLRGGARIRLDEIPAGLIPSAGSRYPFSFVFADRPSGDILDAWARADDEPARDGARIRTATTWTDPAAGLRIRWETSRFDAFPAVEWLISLENAGEADTPIIRDCLALDLTIGEPLPGAVPYRLHRTNGAPSNPTDFEP